jgi:O-antigen ligase
MIEGGTTNLPVFLLKILVILFLSLYFFSCLKEGRFIFPKTPIDLPVAAFLALSALSVITAPYKYMAIVWAQLIFTYAAYFYLSNWAFRGKSPVMYVAVFITAMGALESAVGLAQWVSGSGRVHGTFFNPNMLAGYLAPAALTAISLVVFKGRPRLGKTTTVLLVVLLILFLSVLFLTGSRGGVLAFSAGLAVILIARYRTWAAVTVAVFLAAALLIPNPVRDRAFSSSDPYAYSRADIWKSAATMTADHPMGVGLGNFKYYWPRYNFPVDKAVIKYGKIADTAHNEYLHMAAEAGIPALIAFLIIIGVLFVALRKNAGDEETGKIKGAYIGLAAGGTALLVHAAVDSNLHEPGIVFLLLLMVSGLINKQGQAEKRRETVPDQKAGKRLGAAAFTASSCFLTSAVSISGTRATWPVIPITDIT